MELVFKINESSLNSMKNIIEDLNSKRIFDWNYFWEFSNLNDSMEFFVGSFEKSVDWNSISKNEHIKWTDKRIELFSDLLNFQLLSENKNLACSESTIKKYKSKWLWRAPMGGDVRGKRVLYILGGLSANPNLPLNLRFLQEVEQDLDFRALGQNPSLFFKDMGNYHPETIYEYEDSFERTYHILSYFENKWCKDGSYWDDGDFHGNAKDSIYDNPNIDWDYFQEYKNNVNKNNSSSILEKDDLPF
jgi:hypothetical protein